MRLRELEAEFLKIKDSRTYSRQDSIDGADGIMFLCPLCFAENKGPVGTHRVICWFSHVDAAMDPKPGRWNPSGSGLDDLTFVGPGAASVKLIGGCNWHGFVKDGEAA